MSAAVINIGLRALTMGSKTVLLFFLARVLGPADLGLYGLVTATVGYGIMVLGLDFYTFANRELLSQDRETWATIIRDQAVLYAIAYTAALPVFLLLFVWGVLPSTVAVWTLGLLLVEHVAQEINRLLIALGRPLTATAVFFVRSGVWTWPVLVAMLLSRESQRLGIVFSAWIVGGLVATIIGVWVILREVEWNRRERAVNWSWIGRGVKVSLLFLAATLCLRGLLTIDRFIVRSVAGLELLGVYTFYVSCTSAVTAFLDSGVFAFKYPPIVAAFRRGDYGSFGKQMRRLWQETTVATTILMVGLAAVIKPVLLFLGRSIYVDHIEVFWILMAAIALYALGMVPHYGLYALGSDQTIVLSHGVGFIVFVVTATILSNTWPLLGVAMGLVAGYVAILIMKSVCYYRQVHRQDFG